MKNTEEKQFTEQWRPLNHFTPQENWMNDPNGLVYYDGLYHLFYQHNPKAHVWGNMSWGHAVSTDLLNWQEKPVALLPDVNENKQGLGYIFSGSVVVDWNNTSGFQQGEHPPLVAIFTHHSEQAVQCQSIAYSNDAGETWTKFEGNPVIENPGIRDFRDPKVFWHQDSKQWVMVLAAGQVVKLFGSTDLKSWQFLSDFGEDVGSHAGEWECPDLFQLTTEDGETKWVLIVSINPGGPNGGCGTQYFVGEFNGNRFETDHDNVKWFDYGPDNYAGVTFDGLQRVDGRRIMIGWMSNWTYAGDLPTYPWSGAMALPRELTLLSTSNGHLLANKPVNQYQNSMVEVARNKSTQAISAYLPQESVVNIEFNVSTSAPSKTTWELTNVDGEKVIIKYNPLRKLLTVDRRNAGFDIKIWTMPIIEAPVLPHNDQISGQMILDKSSLEIFWGDGTTSVTALLFPSSPFDTLVMQSQCDSEKSIIISKVGQK